MLRPSNLIYLYRVRLRRRLVLELLALIGIATGVALVFAALVSNSSLIGSAEQLTKGITGNARLQLSSRGADGLPNNVIRQIQQLPGVKTSAPVLVARATIWGPRGRRAVTLLGADGRLSALGGVHVPLIPARDLVRQRLVGLPSRMAHAIGVRFGGTVHIETGATRTTAPLAAQLDEQAIGELAFSPVLIAPLEYAGALVGSSGRFTRVLVEPRSGQDASVKAGLLRIAGGRMAVDSTDSDVAIFREAAKPTSQSTALFSIFAALVGFLFATSAVLLTVPQRRRFIVDLRMSGHPPATIVQVMLFDALVLGVAGSTVGLLMGDVLSRALFSGSPGYLSLAFPIGDHRLVSFSNAAVAFAAGVVAAAIAVLVPIRSSLVRGGRPDGSGYRKRSVQLVSAGVSVLLVAGAIRLLEPKAAAFGMGLLTVSLLLLLPAAVWVMVAIVRRVGRYVRSPIPALAVMELRSRSASPRTFALAATGAIAVFASVSIGGAHADLQRGLFSSAHQVDGNADIWVSLPGSVNLFATTPLVLAKGTERMVSRVAGVASVNAYRGSFLDIGNRRVWVLAPPSDVRTPVPSRQITVGDAATAERRLRQGGWVVLSTAVARDLHVGVGNRVVLPTPVPIPMRVAAITTNLGWPPGAMVMNATDYAQAWGSKAPSALFVDLAPGVPLAEGIHGVRQALGTAVPVHVEASAEREARHAEITRDSLSRMTQIGILVLGAAVLAMATAMAGVLWQRRPMIAGLKVDGFTQLQLWGALLLESAVLLGTGCLLGAAFGLAGQVMLNGGLEVITGFPVFYEAGWGVAARTVAIVLAVALVMLSIPGYLAVRVRPSPGV